MAGKGSWNSPIYISDDEDEQDVAGQLTSRDFDFTPPNPQSTFSDPVYVPMETNVEPKSALQKRKRDVAFPHPIPSRVREQTQEHSNRNQGQGPSNVETKKARKRRRRMEREEAMTRAQAQNLVPPFAVLPFMPALSGWHPNGPAFDSYPPFAIPAPTFHPKPLVYPDHGGYTVSSRDAMYQPSTSQTYIHPPRNGSGSRHEPSTWVSSMAATGPSNPDLDFWDAYPSSAHVQVPAAPSRRPSPPPPPPPVIAPSRPVTPVPSPVPPPPPPAVKTIVPKKPVSLIIGMNPDQNRHSKHGIFHHSTHTITSLPSGPPNGETYIPNPARTIVMEQLPKTHRTRDFIKSWSKSASGAHPVYFAVDPPSAKALIEFATAELARKAWGSPKLGGGVAGPPVKGKPRADLVRVWWYRVDGVGAGAGVGEIEEGEIEGDAAEREVSVPPEVSTAKKETKKERKARLAREREAKMPKTQQDVPTTLLLDVPAAPSAMADDVTVKASPYAHVRVPERSHLSLPESPPPAYRYQTPVWSADPSWNVPDSAPSLPPASFRPPLPPQHALEAQWQVRYPPVQTTDWGDYSRGSTASNFALSFPADPPPSLPMLFNSGAQVDADVDMELDTPASPTFPHPLPSRRMSDIAMSSSHPSDPGPPPPRVAPVSALPTPTPTPPPPPLPVGPASASSRPSSGLGTPPLEPRAMKNVPKGPSFVKRSLVARHKDLEERLARGKLELEIKGSSSSISAIPEIAQPIPVALAEPVEDAASMEDTLRRLVLKSQKNKLKAAAAPPLVTISTLTPTLIPTPIPTPSDSMAASGTAVSPSSAGTPFSVATATGSPAGFSLDDLAVSFITETIQTMIPETAAPLPPPPPKSAPAPAPQSQSIKPVPQTNASVKQALASKQKQELAAKQKRLEAHIAESKTLMAQLSSARTKQEKDRILAVMRERSRMMEEESQAQPTQTHQMPPMEADTQRKPIVEQAPVVKLRWPVSRDDLPCVLIISDDEDDGSESELSTEMYE